METHTIKPTPTFVALNNKLIAEYNLIYRINDSGSINDYSKFKRKNQLLFQKIEDPNQHQNLIFVDSTFASILADLALSVLLNNINKFNEYILSDNKISLVEESYENRFFTYKLSDFIYLLLFGDISAKRPFNQTILTDRVMCFKNNLGEIDYYSIYELQELQSKLLSEIKIEIDYKVSTLSIHEAKICLKLSL